MHYAATTLVAGKPTGTLTLTLTLIAGKPTGIFALLEEQGRLGERGTDKTFTLTLFNYHFGKNKHLGKPHVRAGQACRRAARTGSNHRLLAWRS